MGLITDHSLLTLLLTTMKHLVLVSLIALTSAEADADALYLSHPSSFNSYYSPSTYYAPQAPLLRALSARFRQVSVLSPRPIVVAKTIPAVPVPVAKAASPVAKSISAVPAVVAKAASPVAKSIPTVPAVVAKAASPVAKTIPAVPVPVAKTIPAGSSVVSTQYHAQDEDKNFSFGYSNMNSARHEAGNAYTGVVGSYTDGRSTVQYVADSLGYRHI